MSKRIAELLLEVNGKPLKPVHELKKLKVSTTNKRNDPALVLLAVCIVALTLASIYFIKEYFYYG